jgi:hypothetical protein
VVCQPARSINRTARAPGATWREISPRCICIASVLACGIASAAPLPRTYEVFGTDIEDAEERFLSEGRIIDKRYPSDHVEFLEGPGVGADDEEDGK